MAEGCLELKEGGKESSRKIGLRLSFGKKHQLSTHLILIRVSHSALQQRLAASPQN